MSKKVWLGMIRPKSAVWMSFKNEQGLYFASFYKVNLRWLGKSTPITTEAIVSPPVIGQ